MSTREKMPKRRRGDIFEVRSQDDSMSARVQINRYQDGRIGEIFIDALSKEGAFISDILDAFSITVSRGLQYGVKMEDMQRAFSQPEILKLIYAEIMKQQ